MCHTNLLLFKNPSLCAQISQKLNETEIKLEPNKAMQLNEARIIHQTIRLAIAPKRSWPIWSVAVTRPANSCTPYVEASHFEHEWTRR